MFSSFFYLQKWSMFHKLAKSVLLPTDFHIIRGILEVFMLTKFRKDQKHNNLAALYKTCFNHQDTSNKRFLADIIPYKNLFSEEALNTPLGQTTLPYIFMPLIYLVLCMWWMRSTTRVLQAEKFEDSASWFLHISIILTARAIEGATDLYPHSLSYQETSLTKLSFRAIPALQSKMLDLLWVKWHH